MLWRVSAQRQLQSVIEQAALDALFVTRWQAAGLRIRASRPRTTINRPDAPVLMLPGVYESPHFLDPLAAVIRPLGRPVYSVSALRRNRGRIADSAILVRDYLERLGLHNVTIIAHSKGGLIGKQLMVWPETSERIASMIAIATPFAGSRYARRAPGRVLRDFSPVDATVLSLAANRDANARIISVFGPFDPQIPDGSQLAGARNVLLHTAGHFRPLGDRRLHHLLREVLVGELGTANETR